jgi:hypothetical protein
VGKPRIRINMTKNKTRKGLAFGAGFALVASGFAGVPASAAGIEDLITLLPGAGPENAFTVFSGDRNTFTLTAEKPGTLSGKTHFLVEDSAQAIEASINSTGLDGIDLDSVVADKAKRSVAGLVTITDDAQAAPVFAAGDRIFLDTDITMTTGVAVAAGYYTVKTATAAANSTFTFETDVLTASVDIALATGDDFYYIHSGREADGSFVIDTADTAGEASIELVVVGNTARSASVTAWDDSTANNVLGNEYKSPVRTVTWADLADITFTTSLVAPNVNDPELTANVSSSPVINADYVQASGVALTEFLSVLFTRQGSSSVKAPLPIGKAAQSDVTGVFEVSINLESETDIGYALDADETLDSVDAADKQWALLESPTAKAGAADFTATTSSILDEVATIEAAAAHKLKVGDRVRLFGVTSGDETVIEAAAGYVVTSTPTTTSFTVTIPDVADDAAMTEDTDSEYTLITSTNANQSALVDNVFAGDYSARAIVSLDAVAGTEITGGDDSATFTAVGLTSELGVSTPIAADISFSTTGSTSVQGVTVISDNNVTTDSKVAAGTLAASVVATVLDEDGDAVGAGRSVAYTIVRSHTTLKVNGLTTPVTLVTNASGQVTFNVTDSLGEAGRKITIKAVAEGVSTADTDFTFEWVTAGLTVVDLNTTASEIGATETRTITANSSYVLDVLVANQWFTAADSASYRLKVTGQGVTSGFVPLVAGKASITVADTGVSVDYDTVITLQKLTASTGLFADTTVVKTITNKVVSKSAVTLGGNGNAIYDGKTADLSDAVALKAIVELDTRQASGTKPAYGTFVTVTGKITNATSGVSQLGSLVTISGSSNILFEHGSLDVAKRGSLTFLSDATDGEFGVNLYSTSAQKDTVITVTANGVSSTVKVSFVGAGIGEGTSLVVTMPAAVKPASTFQVKAKLSDVFGNGVATTGGAIKVTYTGAGIVFGTLPTDTDANGELMFSVLLGSNDTGSVNVTVSYDQNADSDYLDAKDLVTAGTTAINASGVVAASSDTKVNVGTFSGKLVVYALNAAGSEVSYKIAGKWVTQVVTSDLLQRYDRVVGATGKTIKVDIYVDGVLKLAKSVVTK